MVINTGPYNDACQQQQQQQRQIIRSGKWWRWRSSLIACGIAIELQFKLGANKRFARHSFEWCPCRWWMDWTGGGRSIIGDTITVTGSTMYLECLSGSWRGNGGGRCQRIYLMEEEWLMMGRVNMETIGWGLLCCLFRNRVERKYSEPEA